MALTVATFPRFKKLYEEAVKEKKKSFFFLGQEILTDYAKYVIEYMESPLKKG